MPRSSQNRLTRRTFMQSTVAAGGALAASAALTPRPVIAGEEAALAPESVVLFQGDSITDAHRDRKKNGPNDWMGCSFVPFQSMFDEATKHVPPAYWSGDGVHPTLAGHALMAEKWHDVVGI